MPKSHPPKIKAVFSGLVVLISLAVTTSLVIAQTKDSQGDPKYRIKPNLSTASPTGVAIPKDLDAALAELDRMLSPALKAEMRQGKLDAMGQYHMGLGMWMRNNWGLWKGLSLAKWFNGKGIFHPDDMSGVILHSYWRHLNGKPTDLKSQAAFYKAYWVKAAEETKVEKARATRAKATIRRMMMGLVIDPTSPSAVSLPPADSLGFRTRYAALYNGGVLLTAKRFTPETFRKEPGYAIRTFFLDLETRELRPVVTYEGGKVEDTVVIGGHAYLNCVSGRSGRIVDRTAQGRTTIPWPAFGTTIARPVRLGIEERPDGTPLGLIATGNGRLARWAAGRWEPIACGKATFPDTVLPARIIGDRLVFRDEGESEDDKRLLWLDLHHPKGLVTFDENVGVVGFEGPRWEFVWDYAPDPSGAWWLCIGEHEGTRSLLRSTPKEGYRVATYNESVRWTEDFFGRGERDHGNDGEKLAFTALQPRSDGSLSLIGPYGAYDLRGGKIRRILRFENTPDDWTPSTFLNLSTTTFLAGGHWGGLYLFERHEDGTTMAKNVGDHLEAPLRL